MFDLFPFFILIFFVMFGLVSFTMFKQFGRFRRIQDRVFDQMESQFEKGDSEETLTNDRTPRDYQCDHCGGRLAEGGDVSPSGDFKCTYCGLWSNIHS